MLSKLLTALVVTGLLLSTHPVQASPDPQCACASCDRPCGSGHSSSCPYGGGGGSDGGGGGGDITDAPLFVAPVGFIGGVFMGAGWHVEEMAGNFPKTGFLDSYGNYVALAPAADNKAFNFGARLGGLPWLALYLPSWPIRAGVVALADVVTRPAPPKPADPNIAVYELIAKNYQALAKTSDQELRKAQGEVAAAELLRTRFLDRFINDSAELRGVRDQNGIAAARDRAQRQLDAWSKARDEKQRLALDLLAGMRHHYATLRAANEAVGPIGSAADLGLYGGERQLDELLKGPDLAPETKAALLRGKKVADLLGKAKTTYDIASNLKGIWDSYAQADRAGADPTRWFAQRETRELVWRLRLKLLTAPLSAPASAAVGATETTLDIAHAAVAGVLLGRQIDADLALLEQLTTARVFQDAQADDWKTLTVALRAAEATRDVISQRAARYTTMQKENETHARNLRKR